MNPSSFDASSPLFPANTQLNITMKRRPAAQLLNFMLPENLNADRGSSVGTLTAEERATAVQYTIKEMNNADPPMAVERNFRVLGVSLLLKDVYLQVKKTIIIIPHFFYSNKIFFILMTIFNFTGTTHQVQTNVT